MKLKLLAVVVAAAGAMAFSVNHAQAQTVLSMSSWVPPSHALTKELLPGWAAKV